MRRGRSGAWAHQTKVRRREETAQLGERYTSTSARYTRSRAFSSSAFARSVHRSVNERTGRGTIGRTLSREERRPPRWSYRACGPRPGAPPIVVTRTAGSGPADDRDSVVARPVSPWLFRSPSPPMESSWDARASIDSVRRASICEERDELCVGSPVRLPWVSSPRSSAWERMEMRESAPAAPPRVCGCGRKLDLREGAATLLRSSPGRIPMLDRDPVTDFGSRGWW